MKKKFIFNKIEDEEFINLFKQLDLLIINFGKPIKYSLHIASGVRICWGEKIVLNVSDEFFTKDGFPKSNEVYEQLEKEGIINDPNSLLEENIKKVNRLLKGKRVKKVKISKWKDLLIDFDDDIEIQIMPDCLERGFEYYRFIEFIPSLKDESNYESIHYIVSNDAGRPRLEIER